MAHRDNLGTQGQSVTANALNSAKTQSACKIWTNLVISDHVSTLVPKGWAD